MAASPITFVVPGQRVDGPTRDGTTALPAATPLGLPGRLAGSVRLGGVRAGGQAHRLQAVPGRDVVVLHIAGGPALVLHPEAARDLLMAQQNHTPRDAAALPSTVPVPAQLQWAGPPAPAAATTRGLLGNVLLAGLDVITEPLKGKAQDWVAGELVRRIDGQVAEGVYALDPRTLGSLKGRATAQVSAGTGGQPALVFVHGTFSTTATGFGKLWAQHPQRVQALFSHYQGRVYALDHATLGASPVENALTLVRGCAKGARLHLVTHSRGGLVAEVLARAAALKEAGPEDLAFFKAEPPAQAALAELVRRMRRDDIRVERVVRVACPARGTLLASKRLDAWVSVFKWALDVAQVPALPELLEFAAGVAQRREDPAKIPGVAAMVPDSALVRWLHAADEPVPGQLRVVAGDLQGDSLGSWLKTLLSDSFFRTDHDLVVNTSAMYGGAPRAGGAHFVLDAGGKVNHFNYFSNERSTEAIMAALTQDAPAGWQVIGPLSWAGESASGVRGAARAARAARDAANGQPASARPAVFVLPGILGSHLAVGGKRIWLGWRLIAGLKRLAYPGAEVQADGAIGMIYEDLMDHLAASHEVIEFSYDWRRPLQEEAQRLGRAVEQALAAREQSGQPVRLLAHSMGGVLARTMQIECGAVWKRLMAHPGARLLMLGTPNGGSFAPMQCLSGDDNFGNLLVAFGAPFQDRGARQMMAEFPGFLQLQAGVLDPAGLGREQTWRDLALDDINRVRQHNWWHSDERQLAPYEWGIPPQKVLDAAATLRRALDQQRDRDLPQWKDKLALVVGRAKFTPEGWDVGDDGLVYTGTADTGDGRVPLASALLPGVRTWQLDAEHGSLPDVADAFEAYTEILATGSTQRLKPLPTPGAQRGGPAAGAGTPAVALQRSRPSRQRQASGLPGEHDPLRAAAAAEAGTAPRRLAVAVHNGDLKFTRDTLLVGHYVASQLSGTEAVVNRLLGGTMADSLAMGQYPEGPGTHQIFANRSANLDNPLQMPRPEGVVVVGLGPEGRLKPADLMYTVKCAVLAQAQRLVEQPTGTPALFDLAATLIGSGGVGISPGQAAQLVAQGAAQADQALAEVNAGLARNAADGGPPPRQWPRLGRLHFVELYLDRATEALRALRALDDSQPGRWQVADTVECDPGALRRPLDSGYRGAGYDLITAVAGGPAGDERIAYTIDTKRARSEVRAQSTQVRLVRELVEAASRHDQHNRQIGRTLFQLLVPLEMQPVLGGGSELLLRLNAGSAGIPWELLDIGDDGAPGQARRPWALRTRLLRTLLQQEFRQQVVDASADADVLVVGEPQAWRLDATGQRVDYLPLPGARHEARAVAAALTSAGGLAPERVLAVLGEGEDGPGPDAHQVIGALLERPWRIVHIAGHGEPALPAANGEPADPRGVVLSNGTFLGPREIDAMRVVPELVFVNCCHLAKRAPGDLLRADTTHDRAAFAGSVAEALVGVGVRCVVAAGWAVDDAAAATFATTLYGALLKGARFIDAVGQAREAAWELGGNTWAAYQCYGDPEWTLRRSGGDAQRPATPLGDEFAGVSSPPALTLALETLVVQVRYQGRNPAQQLDKVRHLQARFGPLWGDIGAVAEALGLAFDTCGDRERALHWYQQALAANDGSASLGAAQQLANLQVREAWARVRSGGRAEVAGAREHIAAALKRLDTLVALHPTPERHMLRASAHKRLAMVARVVADAAAERSALAAVVQACDAAEQAAAGDPRELHYPLANRLAAQVLQGAAPAPDTVARLQQLLQQRAVADPDFWCVVGLAELRLVQALAAGALAGEATRLAAEFADLQARVPAQRYWETVADQADWLLGGARPRGAEADAALRLHNQLRGYAGLPVKGDA